MQAFPTKDLSIAIQAESDGKDANEVVDVLQVGFVNNDDFTHMPTHPHTHPPTHSLTHPQDLVSPKKRPLHYVYLALAVLQLSLQDWNGALESARQLRQKLKQMAVDTKLEAPRYIGWKE